MRHAKPTVASLEALYRDRGGDFFKFAVARTGDEELAREAVQEGFARALRRRRTFRGTGPFAAWVARCVINAAHDLAAARAAAMTDVGDEGMFDVDPPDAVVRAAIRALPDRQREALFLRFYLDFDYATIAATLGIEVGTVSATLSAARAALSGELKEVLR
jgi:RNA polymerase sigma factor (sigma-70 family)